MAQGNGASVQWDREADVVVIGSGATGMPAAIVAREHGLSVILVEAEGDIGGHAITSGGNVPLGGGNTMQKKYGIEDSPDLMFRDLTDWSVVQPNGSPDYRYNDREIVRAFCDSAAATHDFLVANGVTFHERIPDDRGGNSVGNSVPREVHCAPVKWALCQTGEVCTPDQTDTLYTGNGLMRPLEASAREKGVEILLEHRMIALHREGLRDGRVTGIQVTHKGQTLNIRAGNAVVIATGGSTGNIDFRRMFDPRLTEEYCGLAGMPWSNQDASGEIAAMEVGAALWGLFNQAAEFGFNLTKPVQMGAQYIYRNLTWKPGSRVFDKARASGLMVKDFQDVIHVNMIGQRFFDETGGQYTANNTWQIDPYVQGDWRNSANVKYAPSDYMNAALKGLDDGHNGGGPIWAIFDQAAVERNGWVTEPPHVDYAQGFFFQADTLEGLAAKIKMQYQRVAMPPAALEATVARYNGFVASGVDEDFAKPKPLHKIERGPFYAAWATPVIHDTMAGLRIDARCRVVDLHGKVIPGLYCGGESAGGFSQHGLARATCQGYIIGNAVAQEPGNA